MRRARFVGPCVGGPGGCRGYPRPRRGGERTQPLEPPEENQMTDPSWADHIQHENDAVELQHGQEAGLDAAQTVWPSGPPAPPEHSPAHDVGVDLVEGGAVVAGAGAATLGAAALTTAATSEAVGLAVGGTGLVLGGGAIAAGGAGLLAYDAVTEGPLNEPLNQIGEGISNALDPV